LAIWRSFAVWTDSAVSTSRAAVRKFAELEKLDGVVARG
jgi:hypothetical protein